MLRFITLLCLMSASAIHVSPIADAQPYRYDLEHFVHEACDYERAGPEETSILASETDRATPNDETT